MKPLGDKEYEKALRKLHVELVKLQQWVVSQGLKVCIVFEGRDGAGKGGTIKAITERVSPRVFRVSPCRPRPTKRRPSSIFNAISRICRPPAKSSFSTAAGITGPALNG
jgi:polyphosphate kinase 2 (PPK2 family)